MTGRIFLSRLLLLAFLGLAACSQAQSAPPTETSQPAAISTIAAGRTPAQNQPQEPISEPTEAEPAETEELLLTTPTLGPTATPGILSVAVEKAVSSISAETPRFLGLAVEDWIDLLISMVFVVLVLTLVTRVVFSTMKKLASQTPTRYDEQFIELDPVEYPLVSRPDHHRIRYRAAAVPQPGAQTMAGPDLFFIDHRGDHGYSMEAGRQPEIMVPGKIGN